MSSFFLTNRFFFCCQKSAAIERHAQTSHFTADFLFRRGRDIILNFFSHAGKPIEAAAAFKQVEIVGSEEERIQSKGFDFGAEIEG